MCFFISYWMDRYAPEDRLVITYEGLTDDVIGPEVAKSLNDFLGKAQGVTPIDRESVPCVWRAVVKNESPATPPPKFVPPQERPQQQTSSNEILDRQSAPVNNASSQQISPESDTPPHQNFSDNNAYLQKNLPESNATPPQKYYPAINVPQQQYSPQNIFPLQQGFPVQHMIPKNDVPPQQHSAYSIHPPPANNGGGAYLVPPVNSYAAHSYAANHAEHAYAANPPPPASDYGANPYNTFAYGDNPYNSNTYGASPYNANTYGAGSYLPNSYNTNYYNANPYNPNYANPPQPPRHQMRRRLDPGHHDSLRKGPNEPRPYTPQQLDKIMNMLLEVAERYKEDARLYRIMMGYYEKVKNAKES